MLHKRIYQAVWCHIPEDSYRDFHCCRNLISLILQKDQHSTKNGHKFNILPANFGQDRQSDSGTCKIQSGNYICIVHAVPDCGPVCPKHVGGILNL